MHLVKDVGMIPESLAKVYPEINSYLITYNNGDYPYNGKYIHYTNIVFLNKHWGTFFDVVIFIKKNSEKIDVLNLYHLNLSSFLFCIAAKLLLKKDAKIYLKLDADLSEIEKIRKRDIRSFVKRLTISMADIVSAETSEVVNGLNAELNNKIKLIPNGYFSSTNKIEKMQKSDRIITVGRLGEKQKNVELLVNAFSLFANEHNWELRLIGTYTDDFKRFINNLIDKKPILKDRIVLVGEIVDKDILYSEYEKAKIFALPSRWESFGLVLTEALLAGDYILVSDRVPFGNDIIGSSENGEILPSESVNDWAVTIRNLCKSQVDWNGISINNSRIAKEKYCWDNIVKIIKKTIDNT